MRRSKSNPAKYATNYRKISQRHMTSGDRDGSADDDCRGKVEDMDITEKKKLESIIHQSELTWKRGLAQNERSADKNNIIDRNQKKKQPTKTTKKRKGGGDDSSANNNDADDVAAVDNASNNMLSLLSPELRAQFADMGNESLVILPSKKRSKKSNKTTELPPLTKEEIRAAKLTYKNAQRKLAQLEHRKKQKEVRATLYKELEQNTLLNDNTATTTTTNDTTTAAAAQSLLLKSSELGKKITKKQQVKHLRQKEQWGIQLTNEEMDLLYDKYDRPNESSFFQNTMTAAASTNTNDSTNDSSSNDINVMKQSKKTKNKKKKRMDDDDDDDDDATSNIIDQVSTGTMPFDEDKSTSVSSPTTTTSTTPSTTMNFAQMMLNSISTLKTKTDVRNEELINESSIQQKHEEDRLALVEVEERKLRTVYIPTSDNITISTMKYHHLTDAATTNNSSSTETNHNSRINEKEGSSSTNQKSVLQSIHRPADIEVSRYDLPVSSMEYEIIDAIRNNDCVILCGETGSGKSTQVPQFLFEAGFCISSALQQSKEQQQRQVQHMEDNNNNNTNGASYVSSTTNDDTSSSLLIGITQPRRVAAVSTAKRVCYEMGYGTGITIGNNNLVAYQTRYESAGLGSSTRIKFMTDGILLQEIQSDLLLRKYGAIIIDEAHERNLNTDILLGLLSLALPLRQKAALEGSLPPLKLIIMSATLRVDDFMTNTRLFPSSGSKPALVTVPGRTYPVSIHHSKVTELDDYEKKVMEKVCNIHRKLPRGGILVFLTGKQEIVRCVNRLKQRLGSRKYNNSRTKKLNDTRRIDDQVVGMNDVHHTQLDTNNDSYRDMDDDEVDGDLYQKEDDDEEDDYDCLVDDDNDNPFDLSLVPGNNDEDNNKLPTKVQILPLYSMLSTDEQAKVFAPVPENTRLIVIATNIAETSITIPGISYVVDCGRQKCRNYHAGTGVASYDVMWISKAAADQRAGRAGRTGPGHCYRLYSSSVYSRHLDDFALPEVLTRPLEDIVLAMKAMNVRNVISFPFPTPPNQSQITAAVTMLANLGCIDVSKVEEYGGDGTITPLGAAVAQLPLGVRYGKMLLVAAQARVLDYAIALVALLSESSPFVASNNNEEEEKSNDLHQNDDAKGLDEIDRNHILKMEQEHQRGLKSQWVHDGGDVLSALKAVGAYAYAGRGAGGASEKLAYRQFCEENGLQLVIMQRIAKMRLHLCKLAQARLRHGGGIAAETGKYLPSMPPPTRNQECLLRQAIASGLLDNIARRAPPGMSLTLNNEFSGIPRSAYVCGNTRLKEPLFIDNNSSVHSTRPEWVCFDSIVRKTKKDGTSVTIMQRVTPIDVEWLGSGGLCHGSNLITLGDQPLTIPAPRYVKEKDSIQCAVESKFGGHGWIVPPCFVDMYDLLQKHGSSLQDDSYRWFARYLLEGKVLPELSGLSELLNDEPAIITRRKPMKKIVVLVSALTDAGVDSAMALRKHWAEKDDKFLFKMLKPWVKQDSAEKVKTLWIGAVLANVNMWRSNK